MHTFASVAVVDRRGWLLMQERDEHAPVHPDTWGLPGGGLEPGEDHAEAAIRELAEETGLEVTADALTSLGRTRFHSPPCGTEDDYELFVVHADVGDTDVSCGEGRQMVFVDPASLFDRPLLTAARMQLPDVLDSAGYRQRFGGEPARRFAGVGLVDRQGALLLQERDEHPLLDPERWGFPGGHLEPGETFAQGAARELAEETGVLLAPDDLVLVDEVRVDHRAEYGTVDRMRFFVAPTALEDDEVECREGRQMVFVDPETVRGLPLTRSAALVVAPFLMSDLYATLAT
ncbi:NUDIX domain-containing protein [Nocardioides euryhalodurans]|nr:NUDIX domain-containing protein [Nocardioides euryhalodurans]